MCKFSEIKHLSKEDIIKNGSIFTPRVLVDLVLKQCEQYITPNTTVLDLGSGYGAFIDVFRNKGKKCIGTECDEMSVQFLKQEFPTVQIHFENSLLNVSRKKYNIDADESLVIVGNPPYNDITSIYRKGEKGDIVCDDDLKARDFGISFVKAYNKLKADYVCVLHPLSYLIKKQNFNQLGAFKNNYRLLSAITFSSKMFETINNNSANFPVVVALYERNSVGMVYDDIQSFSFEIFGTDKKLCLNKIKTIDGIIKKYPLKNSEANIQFYTLRDMNALMRNTSFVNGPIANGVDVSIDNLYQYAWLLFLKDNFNPLENEFIYGNLSPLYSPKIERKDIKHVLAEYAFQKSAVVSSVFSKNEIESKYGAFTSKKDYGALHQILNELYV